MSADLTSVLALLLALLLGPTSTPPVVYEDGSYRAGDLTGCLPFQPCQKG